MKNRPHGMPVPPDFEPMHEAEIPFTHMAGNNTILSGLHFGKQKFLKSPINTVHGTTVFSQP